MNTDHPVQNPRFRDSGSDEPDWQAWRYVAGEMAAAERDEFEAQLLERQELRERVAAARELLDLLLAAEPVTPQTIAPRTGMGLPRAGNLVPTAARVRRWSRRAQWMTMGAAAALLLALGQQWLRTPDSPSQRPGASATRAGVKPELALAWSETRDWLRSDADADFSWLERELGPEAFEAAAQPEAMLAGPLSEGASFTAEAPFAGSTRNSTDSPSGSAGDEWEPLADPLAGLNAPDWMMAAVRAEAGGGQEEPSEPGEEI